MTTHTSHLSVGARGRGGCDLDVSVDEEEPRAAAPSPRSAADGSARAGLDASTSLGRAGGPARFEAERRREKKASLKRKDLRIKTTTSIISQHQIVHLFCFY